MDDELSGLSLVGSQAFADRSGDTTLIYSAPTTEGLAYAHEMEQAARRLAHLRFVRHISDDEGFVDRDYLEQLLDPPLSEHLFYLCGPEPMVDSVREFLIDAGVALNQIIVEDFTIR